MVMKLSLIIALVLLMSACAPKITETPGGDPNITFIGRTDFSDPAAPKQWAAGGYFTFGFEGGACVINISDENVNFRRANILEIAVDDWPSIPVITKDTATCIVIGEPNAELSKRIGGNAVKCLQILTPGIHHVTVCRNTETAMGYTQVNSIQAQKVFKWTPGTKLKIEFIGNSITCGAEADTMLMPSKQYQWGDWHRAYLGYGPRTARKLGAQWSLVSVSGIGLIHSCCEMEETMPLSYDKFVLRYNQKPYDFSTFKPDLICICLGQNDGIQDSTAFCTAYVDFVKKVKSLNPNAKKVVLLTSPMDNGELTVWLKKMLDSVSKQLKNDGISDVYTFHFSRAWNSGGATHPDIEEHEQIANELSNYLYSILKK